MTKGCTPRHFITGNEGLAACKSRELSFFFFRQTGPVAWQSVQVLMSVSIAL